MASIEVGQSPSSFKFKFMSKIIQESQQKWMYKPHRFRQPYFQSAKDTIRDNVIAQRKKKPRLYSIRGQIVSGCKKPIQQHMHSFLLGIRQKIKNQFEKTQLPQLVKAQEQTQSQTPQLPKNHQSIFQDLKELRSKGTKTIDYKIQIPNRQYSQIVKRRQYNQTIKYATQIDKNQSLSLVGYPSVAPVEYKKGYMAYDQSNKQFINRFKQNLSTKHQVVPFKSKEITAEAFFVMDSQSLTPIAERNKQASMQIASLSKIMTCYLSLLICEKYAIDPKNYDVRVSQKSAETPGTTAELQRGDLISVYDLLFGLMLPSGNDASVALAQGLGKIIQRNKKKSTKKSYYQTFIAHMNILARELQLNQTWNNSSGLSMNPNFSTLESIVVLTALAMRNSTFRKIVNTKTHEIDIKNQWFGVSRHISWRNTNKLLDSGWEGVKTGTTQTAGHCMMAKKNEKIICVLACETLARRFSQCEKLYSQYC